MTAINGTPRPDVVRVRPREQLAQDLAGALRAWEAERTAWTDALTARDQEMGKALDRIAAAERAAARMARLSFFGRLRWLLVGRT